MSKLTGFFVKNGYRATCNHYRKLVYPLFLILLVLLLTSPVQAKYSGGTGEPNNPYQIADATDMNEIGANPGDWGSYFKLTADIDLGGYTGTSFNIIGIFSANPFTGVFDGNGHTISNFTYDSNGINYIGLFGYVYDPNAEIKNLGLIDSNVDGGTGRYVGALVGRLRCGTVIDCNLVGGSVSGGSYVGGLVGYNFDGGVISNCYSKGGVTGVDSVGGLVGQDNSGDYTKSFWDNRVNPHVNGIGYGTDPNVIGKPTTEMQTENTYTDAGWDFVEIWDIGENQTYPYLRQYPTGDLNHNSRVDFEDFAIFADHWLAGVE